MMEWFQAFEGKFGVEAIQESDLEEACKDGVIVAYYGDDEDKELNIRFEDDKFRIEDENDDLIPGGEFATFKEALTFAERIGEQ